MIASNAAALTGDSILGSLDVAAKEVVRILRSQEPEDEFLSAIANGAIPDEVGLELAEVFGEYIKVQDLENLVEIFSVLSESDAISTPTKQVLSLTIIKMAEIEEARQTETGNKPEEVMPVPSSVPTLEATVPAPTQTPPVNSLANLVRQATELWRQFGITADIPAEKLDEIRQRVVTERLTAELRQFLGGVILAQAESDIAFIDLSATLEVIEILLRRRQRELTEASFGIYETLFQEGIRLKDRDGFNYPLMTVKSLSFLRNHLRNWLDNNQSVLGKNELATAEKAVYKIESFLVFAGHESIQRAIEQDLDYRLRKQIIVSGVEALDMVNDELVAALPQNKEEALKQAHGYLWSEVRKLRFGLQTIGSKTLAEADGTLEEILIRHSWCSLWRSEVTELDASSDYNPANQQPELSVNEKRLAFFEVERKNLDEVRIEIEKHIKQVKKSRGSDTVLKKISDLRDITLRKIADLDQLTAQLRFQPARSSTDGVNGTSLPSLSSSTTSILPPPPPVTALAESDSALVKEARHGFQS